MMGNVEGGDRLIEHFKVNRKKSADWIDNLGERKQKETEFHNLDRQQEDINPFIQLYRMIPEMRTDWEKKHILGVKDLTFARRFFKVKEVKYWHMLSLLSVPFRKTRLFRPLQGLLNAVDMMVLKVPYLKRTTWQFTFVLQKPLVRE